MSEEDKFKRFVMSHTTTRYAIASGLSLAALIACGVRSGLTREHPAVEDLVVAGMAYLSLIFVLLIMVVHGACRTIFTFMDKLSRQLEQKE